jgi:hypothetical protein
MRVSAGQKVPPAYLIQQVWYHPVFVQVLPRAQGLLGCTEECHVVFFDENTDEGLLAGEFSNFANSLITNAIMAARFAQVMHDLKYYARHVGLLESRGAHALWEI